ncbi:MAG: metallopeptidase family protein [Magnetovibrionaceae bacterium]
MPETYGTAPDLIALERLADQALLDLPEAFRTFAQGLTIRVEDFPADDVVQEMKLESAFDLLGLYQGVPLNAKSLSDTPEDLDRVFLYRRPILDYWAESGETLEHLVRHVLIHEIGHHFGLSDDDMHAIEEETD